MNKQAKKPSGKAGGKPLVAASAAAAEVGDSPMPQAASLEAFVDMVRARLLEMGLSAPWANLMVDLDLTWITSNWETCSVERAAREVFDEEMPSNLEGYRDRVSLFLHEYGIASDQHDDLMNLCLAELKKMFSTQVPTWSAAAQILQKAVEVSPSGKGLQVRPEALSQPPSGKAAVGEDLLGIELTKPLAALVDQVAGLGVYGNSRGDVVMALLQHSLVDLMRSGLIESQVLRDGPN